MNGRVGHITYQTMMSFISNAITIVLPAENTLTYTSHKSPIPSRLTRHRENDRD